MENTHDLLVGTLSIGIPSFIYLFLLKLLSFFHVPGRFGMFRNVPACSGMFHVPGFIDAP